MQASLVCHTYMSSSFVIVRIPHTVDRHTTESLVAVMFGTNACTARECAIGLGCWGLFASSFQSPAKPPGGIFIGCSSTVLKTSIYFHILDYHQFALITILLSSSASPASDDNVSGSQIPVFPPTIQHQFLLSTPPYLVVSTISLHLVVLLGAIFFHVVVRWLP